MNSEKVPEKSSLSVRIGRAIRHYFFTGLATLFPLTVTVYITLLIFRAADNFLWRTIGLDYPGLGLILTFLLITFVGLLSVHVFGRFVIRVLEFWINRLPLVKKIYPAVKQFTGFIFESDSRRAAFRRVVLVQYPRLGSYTISFVTNESETDVLGERRTLLTLLVPQPPSPFTGPIIIVPKEEVIPLRMTIEEAFKLVVSGGVVQSPLQPSAWE